MLTKIVHYSLANSICGNIMINSNDIIYDHRYQIDERILNRLEQFIDDIILNTYATTRDSIITNSLMESLAS